MPDRTAKALVFFFDRNPFDLGWAGNWRETFDAQGRLWALTWMLPSRRKKQGLGYMPPRRPKAVGYAATAPLAGHELDEEAAGKS